MERTTTPPKNVFIVGGGKTAVRVVNMLPHDMKAKIFENDPRRCEEPYSTW